MYIMAIYAGNRVVDYYIGTNYHVHIIFQWRVWERGGVCTGCWWGNLRERDHWGDPDVDGRIILRWIFRKWEGIVGTGWSRLRIGTGGGLL
jgi:hypothetical protein